MYCERTTPSALHVFVLLGFIFCSLLLEPVTGMLKTYVLDIYMLQQSRDDREDVSDI